MLKGFKRGILLLLSGVIFLSPLFVVITPSTTLAAQTNPQDQLERWLYYRGMRACLENPDFNGTIPGNDNRTISVSDLEKKGLEEHNNKEGFGYLGKDMDNDDSNEGTVRCNDGSIWVRGANLFGFGKVKNLVCAMNEAASQLKDGGRISPNPDISPCVDNATEFKLDGGGGSIWQQMLTKALENPIASAYGGDGDRPSFNFNDNSGPGYTYQSLLYLLGKNSLETFCGESLSSAQADNQYDGSDKGVSVYVVSSDGTIKKSGVGGDGFSHTYTITKKDNESSKVDDVYYRNGGNNNEADDRTCADMARWTREGAGAYAQWAKSNKGEAEKNEGSSTDDSTGSNDDSSTSCGVEGVGWIICPVMDFMGKLNDAAFGFIDNFLYVEPELLQDRDTQAAWSNFRDLANIAFIIVFLVIVYSQITSTGVSNYGVKRMLPRLFIAAILVNLSYFVCQVAVDLSNIAGSSLYSFFKDIPTTNALTQTAADMPEWKKVIAFILVGTGVVAIGLLAISAIGTAALLAFVLVILILIARKALLIILVVIAPLAFVAYLLPNTEKWFKSWWKMFSTLLMVFPIVAVIFGASTLAARIINNAGGDPSESNYMLQITALGVMALPLFAVPLVLKGAMSAAGTLGARLQGMADKAQGGAGAKGKERRSGVTGDMKNRWEQASANGKLGVAGGLTRRRMRRDFLRSSREAEAKRAEGAYTTDLLHGDSDRALAYQRAAGGGLAGGEAAAVRAGARATQQAHKIFDEDVAAHKTTLSGLDHAQLLKIMKSPTESAERRAAAAGTIMGRGYHEGKLQAIEAAQEMNGQGDAAMDSVQKQMAHDMSGKPFGLSEGALTQLATGKLGQETVDEEGNKKAALPAFNESLAERARTKLSGAGVASMDPDELKRLHQMALNRNRTADEIKAQGEKGLPTNKLSDSQLASFQQAILAARGNEQYRSNIKSEAAEYHQEVLNLGGPGAAPATPSNSGTPPSTPPPPATGGGSGPGGVILPGDEGYRSTGG